ncbi:MAG TPA: MFS transporter [Chloroflexi bacterium]|nr:MFS transporter [Chloroflexota bacterium]
MTQAVEATKGRLRRRVKLPGRNYMLYLILLMGMVALMDQYIGTVKTTALPYILEEYQIDGPRFSYWEGLYLAATFFIFLLNGLTDMIGRKWSIFVLIVIMGVTSLGIVLFAPTFHTFMIMYTLATFATVSNIWSMPISEESPAENRAKYVAVTYIIGLIPLQAILPPIIINQLGLSWKWMYGVMFLFMLPVLLFWTRMRETSRYRLIQQERQEGTRKLHWFGLGVIDKKDIRYIIIAALIWLAWLTYQFFYFWAGYYFMELNGYSLQQWSFVLLGALVFAIGGGYLAGYLMDRLGRKPTLIIGCVGLAIDLVVMGWASGWLLPITGVLLGFFTSFTYTWIVVFVPEVFPTERRGACMGWTTTVARISYVLGPILVGVCLKLFPDMRWFWVVAAGIILVPIALVLFFNPSETNMQELEDIEEERM